MKKKIIAGTSIAALAGIVATAAILTGFTGSKSAQSAAQVRATPLGKGDLAVSISATGTVYSAQSTGVYSNLSYPVKTVHVSAGDFVKEGDVLAELDVSDLELDIAQKKASLSSSQASAYQNLVSAQNDLTTYQYNSENGYDTSLLNAESAVATAELDVKTAELDIETAQNEVRTASQNLWDARNDEGDYAENGATDSQISALRNTLSSKQASLEKSETSLEKAKANLEKAKASYEAAKVSREDSMVNYQNKVKSAQIGANFEDQLLSIQKQESELEKATVLAPVSGTVTAVNAVVGGSGSGQLFIIQDTGNLKVITNIKEYDIGSVEVGNRVTVKTDATGDSEIGGTLSKIAPTSTLTATGDAATSSTDAEYEAEVTVSSEGSKTGLRIGMNAQLSIITEEKNDIYTVPYDAVSRTQDGAVIYEAKRQEDGSFIAQAVSVSTGLENDLYIEVTGDALTDGMMIISDASAVTEGMAVELRGNLPDGEMPSGDLPAGDRQAGGVMGGGIMGGGMMGGGRMPG